MRQSNILDPISDKLDQRVFDYKTPKGSVVQFIKRVYYRALHQKFDIPIEQCPDYVHLILTGSLTTYQYNDTSDTDISVFANWKKFQADFGLDPQEARRELIQMHVQHVDGTHIPGSPHPLQCFAVQVGVTPKDRFKPGLRSGYDLDTGHWVVPPEQSRDKDVQKDFPDIFEKASEVAEQMKTLLDAGDSKTAIELWKQVHEKRQLDQQAGLGDYSESNIIYKWLVHEGIVDRLRNELHLQIATHVVDLDTGSHEFHEQYPGRIPWIYAPSEDTLYVGSGGGYHGQIMDSLQSDYEDAWEGVYSMSANEVMIFSKYDVDEFEPDQIDQNMIKNLQEKWPGARIQYRDLDGDLQVFGNLKRLQVYYDFEKDRIQLGSKEADAHSRIVGEYDPDENAATLYEAEKQWINPTYFRRLWNYSFPERPLKSVHFQAGEDKRQLKTIDHPYHDAV